MVQQQLIILIIDDCPEDRAVYCRYLLQAPQHQYKILEEETGKPRYNYVSKSSQILYY